MHDDSVLVAIDAALRTPAFCGCGDSLTIQVHDDAAWLECASLATPSRLPKRLASLVRSALHDRRFVIELPTAEAPEVPQVPRAAVQPAGAGRPVARTLPART